MEADVILDAMAATYLIVAPAKRMAEAIDERPDIEWRVHVAVALVVIVVYAFCIWRVVT